MKLEEKIKKLKKDSTKELEKEKSYQKMKKALLALEQLGIIQKPQYNLQTIENQGREIPTFANIKQ